jgi:hypothetical protein
LRSQFKDGVFDFHQAISVTDAEIVEVFDGLAEGSLAAMDVLVRGHQKGVISLVEDDVLLEKGLLEALVVPVKVLEKPIVLLKLLFFCK